MLISSRLWIFLMTIWMETLVGKASKQKWNKVLYIKCTENDSTPLVFVFSWWNLEYIDIVGIYGILVPPYARYFVNSSPKNVLCRLDEISLMALENGKENFWLSLNNFAIFSPLIRVLFKECFMPSLVEIHPGALKNVLKCYRPLEKRRGPSFEQTFNPHYPRMFCMNFG